jgi:hypothetical protein
MLAKWFFKEGKSCNCKQINYKKTGKYLVVASIFITVFTNVIAG